MYLNPRAALASMLTTFGELGVAVVTECWAVGPHPRTALRFRELGLLGSTLWGELVFTGAALPGWHGLPTALGLQAMLELPPGEPWSVACMQGSALELAQWAIELGGHVALGLGDWPYHELGQPTNAEIVAHVGELARRTGRELATPDQARRLLAPGRLSWRPGS